MSAAFAFVADSVLVLLGGKFKFKEKLSGRLADVLIHLYMGSAMLKRFEDDGRPAADMPLLQWGMEDSLFTIQQSLLGVIQNFPVPCARPACAADYLSFGPAVCRAFRQNCQSSGADTT